jgi:hypothetical protein
MAEGQPHAAGIVALAPFDDAVDDTALDFPPEIVGRKTQFPGDNPGVDDKAVRGMGYPVRAVAIHSKFFRRRWATIRRSRAAADASGGRVCGGRARLGLIFPF